MSGKFYDFAKGDNVFILADNPLDRIHAIPVKAFRKMCNTRNEGNACPYCDMRRDRKMDDNKGAVQFKVTAPDGKVYIGPIHGSGGLIGGGESHLPRRRREAASLERAQAILRHAKHGEPLGVAERKPGHFTVYIAYDRDGGSPIEVRAVGATITLASKQDVKGARALVERAGYAADRA